MKKIIITLFCTTFLLADNPTVYSALGDVIYNNADNINNLKTINQYNTEISKIDKYVSTVDKTKKDGFSIQRGEKKIDKMDYLNHLRELSITNDYFVRSAKNNFKHSLSKEDSVLFSKIINSGLVDTQKYKEKIINYYFAHAEDINASGIVQSYLDEDKELRVRKETQIKLYQSKKMREAAKIKRIRRNDKEKQASLEKKLEDEVKAKKIEIRQEQKSELFNPK
ncbi:MAG: hypothetical protein QM497_02085 [Sulfurimonas sp.]